MRLRRSNVSSHSGKRLTRATRGSRAEADWEGGDIPSANADRLRGVGAGALAGMLAGFRQLAGLL